MKKSKLTLGQLQETVAFIFKNTEKPLLSEVKTRWAKLTTYCKTKNDLVLRNMHFNDMCQDPTCTNCAERIKLKENFLK